MLTHPEVSSKAPEAMGKGRPSALLRDSVLLHFLDLPWKVGMTLCPLGPDSCREEGSGYRRGTRVTP